VQAVTHFLRPSSLTAEETLESGAASPIYHYPIRPRPGMTSRLALCPDERRQQRLLSVQKNSQRYTAIQPAIPVRQPSCLIAKSAVSC
jgi:hypothetical protein